MRRRLELKHRRSNTMHSRMLPTLFLILGISGFILLWGFMLSNGTLDAMDEAKQAGAFPDGRPLRLTYTGFPLLDSPLTTLVIFFDGVTNGLDPGSRLLLIDISFMLQAAALWVLIESRREGYISLWLRMPSLWGALWNGFGAAIVLPLYCLVHLRNRSANQASAVPLSEAKALLPTTALGLFLPLILILPPTMGCRIEHQQAFIALFQASPFIFVLIQQIVTRLIKALDEHRSLSNSSKPFVVASYIFAGLSSAAAHIYVLIISLFAKNTRIAFNRVFIPSLDKIDPRAPSKITEGAHLFLQYDWIIINLTCMLYVYLLLEAHMEILIRHMNIPSVSSKVVIMLLVTITTVILGPGAAVSFACAIIENRLQGRDTGKTG